MNKWGPLLLAVFCIFQPIFSENLFDGREKCLQRPDFNRKDSRLLEDQSKARPEIRVDAQNSREFSERLNQHGLRYSERNNNRDENISDNRRSRSNDRIRVSLVRQRIADNLNEGRSDGRSSRNTRLEPELQNVREDRRISTERVERGVRNVRLIRSLSQDDRRNQRQDIRARKMSSRDSQFAYAPNRRIVEHFDDIRGIREDRELNERKESRRQSRDSRVDARIEVIYDRLVKNDDFSQRSNERLQRKIRSNVPDNRRQNERSESIIRARHNNEISERKVPSTSRIVINKRISEERKEADRSLRREMKEWSDKSNVRLDDARRQANERMMRIERNVPAFRRSIMRLESVLIGDKEIDRRNSPKTAQRTDEARQIRRELKAYVRESVQRKLSEESRDLRRESRDRASDANERYMRSDDLVRRTSERLRDKSEINRRNSPTTRVDERRNKISDRYFQKEKGNSDIADSGFDFQASRHVRRDSHRNSRQNVIRNYVEISRRSSPVSIMNVGDRVENLQGRYISQNSLMQSRERRTDSYINDDSSNDRRDSLERNGDTQDFRRESRRISKIRIEALDQRIEPSKYHRERQFVSPSNIGINRRAAIEKRESMQRNELRNVRREIRAVRLDDNSRQEAERLNNRVQNDVLQRRTRDSNARTRNVELGQENRRVDENARIARDALKDSRVEQARDENVLRRNNRDHQNRNERSLDNTMPVQRQVQMRIQRDDTSRRTRITIATTRRDKFDQSRSQNNREDERIIERRASRAILENNRHESQFGKNTFERNMDRDYSQRLLDSGNRRVRDNRSSRNIHSTNNVKDNENIRQETRLSTTPHDVSSDETFDLSFKWQHLLYLLQAVYIVGMLAKLSQSKGNKEKKTRIGLWTHETKLIKVD